MREIQKWLQSGAFQDIGEVIFRALESQDAEAAWQLLHQSEVSGKIDRAIAQAGRGEGMTPEQSRAWLEEKKAEWRSDQRRPGSSGIYDKFRHLTAGQFGLVVEYRLSRI